MRVAGVRVTGAASELFRFRRQTVSFVFQTFNLFPGLTAMENVQFAIDVARPRRRRAHGHRRAHPGRPRRASGALSPTSSRGRAAAGGDRPGAGDRQPDPPGRRAHRRARLPHGVQILELLHEQAHAGTTVLVVTHNREISRVADRVIELSSGQMVFDGPPPEARPTSPTCAGREPWRQRSCAFAGPGETCAAAGSVAAIALVIAIGSGVYRVLGSVSSWRHPSNDASFAALHMYDLRFDAGRRLVRGRRATGSGRLGTSGTPTTSRRGAPSRRAHAAGRIDERREILVPGRLVGVDLTGGGPEVSDIHAFSGRALDADDIGRAVVVVDEQFVDRHDLPGTGDLELSGGHAVERGERARARGLLRARRIRGAFFTDFASRVLVARDRARPFRARRRGERRGPHCRARRRP